MKRVLHVLQTLSGGGAETLVRALVPRLGLRGFNIEIVAVYRADLDEQARTDLHASINELGKRNRFDVFPFVRLLQITKRFNPDLIHAHTYSGKFWGRAAAAVCGVPAILTEHGAAYSTGLLERFIAGFLDKRTSASVAFSQATAKVVSEASSVKDIRIIPNGVQLDVTYDRPWARKALRCSDDELAIVTIGRLNPEKGPDVALQALRLLPPSLLQRARLHLIGDGPCLTEARALSASLGLTNRVMFHGFRQEARMLLAGADVALSSSRIEAAPLWLIEAMAAGVPVVGTPTLGVNDLVANGQTGLIAASNDAPALAAALTEALSNQAWRDAASRASKGRARQYDIESVADAYSALYCEVIEKRRLLK